MEPCLDTARFPVCGRRKLIRQERWEISRAALFRAPVPFSPRKRRTYAQAFLLRHAAANATSHLQSTGTWRHRNPAPRAWVQRSIIAAVPRGPVDRRKLRALTQLGELCLHGTFLSSTPPRQRGSAPEFKMESLSRAGQEMSLAALKQHDPYITSIADLTGQVALYTFCPKANQWVSAARPLKLLSQPPLLKGAAPTDLGRGRCGRPGWRRRGQGLEESLAGAWEVSAPLGIGWEERGK